MKVDLGSKVVSGTVTKGKQVTAIGESASLPADFPKQVPIYPGAKLTVSHADTQELPNLR